MSAKTIWSKLFKRKSKKSKKNAAAAVGDSSFDIRYRDIIQKLPPEAITSISDVNKSETNFTGSY